MSFPKTGSVTAAAPAGANGTWFAQSRTVSHAAAERAADGHGEEDREDRQGHARQAGSGPACRRPRRSIGRGSAEAALGHGPAGAGLRRPR